MLINHVAYSQVTITACALSMRKQLCTSSEPSNWTHAASVPGLSWVMNTWKWRTLQLPYRPTGQTEGGEDQKKKTWVFGVFIYHQRMELYQEHCSLIFSFFVFSLQTCYWSEQAGLQSLVRLRSDVWDPQDAFLLFVLLPKGSPAQVCILTKRDGFL